jgi:hypothetical protein
MLLNIQRTRSQIMNHMIYIYHTNVSQMINFNHHILNRLEKDQITNSC